MPTVTMGPEIFKSLKATTALILQLEIPQPGLISIRRVRAAVDVGVHVPCLRSVIDAPDRRPAVGAARPLRRSPALADGVEVPVGALVPVAFAWERGMCVRKWDEEL